MEPVPGIRLLQRSGDNYLLVVGEVSGGGRESLKRVRLRGVERLRAPSSVAPLDLVRCTEWS
jgi:hypothetical protein